MLAKFSPPTFFAHRGACAHAPENTLSAFELAINQGAPAIEFDVKLTADRQVIIMHDMTVDRTTNGKGEVRNFSLAALRELDAGSWYSEAFVGEKVPTLDEVFEAVGRKLFINVELTNYSTPFDGLVYEVVSLVKKHGLADRILFSSFFPTNLALARRLLPQTPRGQLALDGRSGWWQRAAGNWMDVQAEHPYTGDVTAESVQKAHARGRRVHVWTVNDPADMKRLRSLGVDAIFTDDPPLALEHFVK